jgi:1,4-alpha-glucan branching enzyme
MAVKSDNKKSVKRKKVSFSVFFPDAVAVYLVGDFNKWNHQKHPMKKKENGNWEKHIFVIPGRYEYKLKVDDQWENDNMNPLICKNDFGTENNYILVE